MKKILVILFILNIFANYSYAIVSGTIEKHKMLDLADCINLALKNSPLIKKSKLEYEKQFNKIKNRPKRKRKMNENKKERKSKFLSKYGKRIEAMRNTEEVKLKNREILLNENKDKEEEFIEKFIEKVEQNKKK